MSYDPIRAMTDAMDLGYALGRGLTARCDSCGTMRRPDEVGRAPRKDGGEMTLCAVCADQYFGSLR